MLGDWRLVRSSWIHRNLQKHKLPEPKSGPADLEMENINYSHTNEGAVKEWELNAKSAKLFKEKNQVFLKDVVVTFYSKTKKGRSTH